MITSQKKQEMLKNYTKKYTTYFIIMELWNLFYKRVPKAERRSKNERIRMTLLFRGESEN